MTRRRIGAERAWESGSPTFVARLKGHTDKVTAAKFVAVPGVRPATGGASFYLGKWSDKHSNITYISEPPLLITASFDNSIRIWHLHPPTPLLIVETPHSVSCMDADVLREGAPRDDDEGTRPMVQALRVVIGSYLGTATLVVIEVVHRPVRAFEFGPAQATEFRLRTIRSLGQVSGSPISKVVLWGSWALVASAGGVKAVHIHKNDVGAVNVAAPVRTDSSGLCIMNVFSTENTIKDVLPITVASPDASHSRSFLFILAQVAPNTRSASPGSNGVTVLDVTEFTHASESRPPMDPKIVSSTILDASVNESGVALYAGRSGTDTTVTVVRKNATRFSSHVSDLLSSVPATAQQQGDSPPWRLLPSDFRSEADSINTCAYDRGRAVWLRTRSWGWWDDAPVMMEGEGGDSVWKRWGRAPRTQDTLECVALDGDLVAVGTGNGFVDVVGFGVEVERA
ncbi:hypothetical protein M427DRAFT_63497 [Gonapodya prolifera JEL478]|uniref:WD40 repeat-like protein n=1 Tax=Gonapodya prolifera (strain JEL478) TaxID=1344416 RepID=A0A138ZZ25_GONPJ|nr:hypothetical protein M427DRAFT_63497 [Gonapodya prolifera JEL478]|eukprot:KXS09759.1 hypothetical protein M427DRAFT_63497 [Gonapodya prolifera JEL478]